MDTKIRIEKPENKKPSNNLLNLKVTAVELKEGIDCTISGELNANPGQVALILYTALLDIMDTPAQITSCIKALNYIHNTRSSFSFKVLDNE